MTRYHKIIHTDEHPDIDLDPTFEQKLVDIFDKVVLYLNRGDMDLEVHVGGEFPHLDTIGWTAGFRIALLFKRDDSQVGGRNWMDENTPLEFIAFVLMHEFGHTHYAPEGRVPKWASMKLNERQGRSVDIREYQRINNIIHDIIINVTIMKLKDVEKIVGFTGKQMFLSKFANEGAPGWGQTPPESSASNFEKWHYYYYVDGRGFPCPQPEVLPLMNKMLERANNPVDTWLKEYYQVYGELTHKWNRRF